MGYDMTMREVDLDEELALADANRDFHDAARRRDDPNLDGSQEEVEAAYERMRELDRKYFRLNIWGMQKWRLAMYGLEMIHEKAEYPDWPTWNASWDDMDDYESTPEYRAYEAECERCRAASAEYPGIPAFKFGSNDGWIVTPFECESAVKIWEAAGSPIPEECAEEPDYWLEWIDYLRRAAKRGGFEVW